MANTFGREVRILFEDVLENFDKDMSLSKSCSQYTPDAKGMQRQGDTYWRPQSFIAEVVDGMDITGQYKDLTGLQVPSTLSFVKNIPWKLNGKELRDDFYRKQQARAARQRLAAQIEQSTATLVAQTGANVVKRGSLTGYSDISECDAVLTEIGVPSDNRHFFLNARDYNTISGTLAGKETLTGRPERSLSENFVGRYAGFDTYKVDVMPNLQAAAGGGSITVVGYDQALTPAATSTAASGEISNVDNRYMNLTVSSTTNVAAGDAFTIAGVYKVHHITKEVTPTLFTFRVISVVNSTTLKVTALIDDGPYQNVDAAPAHGAALTFLNTTARQVNVFWQGDSIEVTHGRLGLEELRGGGLDIMTGTTDQGVQIAMIKQGTIDDLVQKYRWVIFYGVTNLNPSMNGVMLAGQA